MEMKGLVEDFVSLLEQTRLNKVSYSSFYLTRIHAITTALSMNTRPQQSTKKNIQANVEFYSVLLVSSLFVVKAVTSTNDMPTMRRSTKRAQGRMSVAPRACQQSAISGIN